MALNRLGVPRKTHLPSNKPLGKLSTYVKAFTLTVPEHRSELVIGKRFGFNHVTHGIKHLCESGKQLMELTQKQLIYPECQSGSSNGSINSSLSKKQPQQQLQEQQPNHHHIRHAMTHHHHHRRPAPASLTDRGSNRKTASNVGGSNGAVVTKGVNCNTEQCLKKKKPNSNNGNRTAGNNNNNNNSSNKRNNLKKSNAKSTKTRPNKKVQVTTKLPTTAKSTSTTTTTTTSTTTTTESAISYGPTAGLDNVPSDYDDELDYSGSVPISSNSQTGLASDEDYDDDK